MVTKEGHSIKLSAEAEAQYEQIIRGVQEVTSGEIIRKVLSEGRVVKAYWGSATTGRPHIAYCVPLLKIADFLAAGVHVKVLLADLHAFLDASKSSLETVKHRVKYYSILLQAVFSALGVPTDKLEFITGTSYQLSPEYTLDVYKFHALTTTREAEHAGADVVKESESPLMSSLLYPGLQALDEQYLDVDFQFGGVDQRKIFMYAATFLPRLGYAKRAHLMNAMVPGLSGGKMSSSDPKSKIDFLDTPANIKSKIKAAICPPGQVEGNGVLAFIKTVLVPIQKLRIERAQSKGEMPPVGEGSFTLPDAPEGTIFSIPRTEEHGGNVHVSSYEELEEIYKAEKLHPDDLKGSVRDALIHFLEPIRKAFDEDKEWQEIERLAYPSTSVTPVAAELKKLASLFSLDHTKKKDVRSKPPTEEERAVLRALKEKEKAKKATATTVDEGTTPSTPSTSNITSNQLAQSSKDALVSANIVVSRCVTSTNLPKLKLLAKGKVRDIYALPGVENEDKLLFVATDRMSAFDVIMNNGIPAKGVTLTTLSLFWFDKLKDVIPNHVLCPSPSSCFSTPVQTWEQFPRSLDEYRDQLKGRSMIVKRCEVVKIEAIVRGYITGSAWTEYKKSQTVHGIKMPAGLVESQKLPNPLFTPSTKADQGEHDENIHPEKVKDICGSELAIQIEKVAIKLYSVAADYAQERGLILADTKFEFGLLPDPTNPNKPTLILIDEVLTPDSSRYWSAVDYTPGKPQASFDKQYLRDWLSKEGLNGKDGVTLPKDVVSETKRKYEETRDRVMNSSISQKS
nr:phosphoribosylaminoimidazolesuccinocarboxamide synthase [Cryptococcus depauperatus CBS 7855]